MSRRTNFINNVITIAVTLALIFTVTYFCNQKYVVELADAVVFLVIGAVASGFIMTLCHELAHVIAAKNNSFAFISMTVWFFKWAKVKNKIKFSFVMLSDSVGNTETVPTRTDNLKKRFLRVTSAGVKANFVLMLLGVVPFFIPDIDFRVLCILAMFLPIGAYCFFGNALPVGSAGIKNDGAMCYSLKKNDDDAKTVLRMLEIHAELYNGKTFGEIDESKYFDLPQLAEDDVNFTFLLNLRYNYYLDKNDTDNAKKVSERLLSLIDYMPKDVANVVKADLLYNACTFDYNEDRADELVYELEKYLNKVNTVANVRIKLAYILYVKHEKEQLEVFYKKAVREANRNPVKGYGLFEKKLLSVMKQDFIK